MGSLSHTYCINIPWKILQNTKTGPRSAVGNVSGNRCQSDCRSRGCEFDPGPVHTFVEIDHEIISMVILLPSAESFKKVWSHTFVEIDHEIISTVILLPSADLFKKGCCQLQAKVCARFTG